MSPFTGERMNTLKVGMSDTEALSVAFPSFKTYLPGKTEEALLSVS